MYQPSEFRRDDRFVSRPAADRRSGPLLIMLAMLFAALACFAAAVASGRIPYATDGALESPLDVMGP